MYFSTGFLECWDCLFKNKMVYLVVLDWKLWFIFTFHFSFHVPQGSNCSGVYSSNQQ